MATINADQASVLFAQLKSKPENNVCFECNKSNPQWASANLGVFLCLECAGRHRSIGSHLSFVRSLTMDSWKSKEISHMTIGGNIACREFLTRHGCFAISDLSQRYDTPAARAYRAKLDHLVEGKQWVEPPPDELKKKYGGNSYRAATPTSMPTVAPRNPQQARYNPGSGPNTGGHNAPSRGYNPSSTGYNPSSAGYNPSSAGYNPSSAGYNPSSIGYNGGAGRQGIPPGGYSGSSSGRYGGGYNGASSNDYSKDLHKRFGQSTSISSDQLFGIESPHSSNSGGGGYQDSSLMNAVYDGWNKFSTVAQTATNTVTERVKGVDIDGIQETLKEGGQKGWAMAIDYFNMAKQYVGEVGYNNLSNPSSALSNNSGSSYGNRLNQSGGSPYQGDYNSSSRSNSSYQEAMDTTSTPLNRSNPTRGNLAPARGGSRGGHQARGRGRGGQNQGGRTAEEWDSWDSELGVNQVEENKPNIQRVETNDDGWNEYEAWDEELKTKNTSNSSSTIQDDDIWDFRGDEKHKLNTLLNEVTTSKPVNATSADGWDTNW